MSKLFVVNRGLFCIKSGHYMCYLFAHQIPLIVGFGIALSVCQESNLTPSAFFSDRFATPPRRLSKALW